MRGRRKIPERFPDVLTLEELRCFLRVSYEKAAELVSAGVIPACRIGRYWKIPKQGVIDFLMKGGGANA